jgi:hypothetical protein
VNSTWRVGTIMDSSGSAWSLWGYQNHRGNLDEGTYGSVVRIPTKFRTSAVFGMSFPKFPYI